MQTRNDKMIEIRRICVVFPSLRGARSEASATKQSTKNCHSHANETNAESAKF
ncbi:hypothetical protein [Helicobacter sp. 23-1045]